MRALRFTPLLFAAACVPTVTDDLSTITAPRVLAVQSTSGASAGTAELDPGGVVTLRALVATPDGVAVPTLDWQLCLAQKPLAELGPVNTACLARGAAPHVAKRLAVGDTTTAVIPLDACSLFGPNPPPSQGGRPVDPDPTGGYYQPVVGFLGASTTLADVRVACGPGDVVRQARQDFEARYRKNENPEIAALSLVRGSVATAVPPDASSGFSAKRGERVLLRAAWDACAPSSPCNGAECADAGARTNDAGATNLADPASPDSGATAVGTTSLCTGAETYAYYDPTTQSVVDRRESLEVTWYATAGTLDAPRTGESSPGALADSASTSTDNTWTAPTAARDVTLWLVLRDDRGGVSFRTYHATVK
jgi:hypothetical protein